MVFIYNLKCCKFTIKPVNYIRLVGTAVKIDLIDHQIMSNLSS